MSVRMAVPSAFALALVGLLVVLGIGVVPSLASVGLLAAASVIFLAVLIWSSEWNPLERLRRAVLVAALLVTGPIVLGLVLVFWGDMAMPIGGPWGLGAATVVALAFLTVRSRVLGATAAAMAVLVMAMDISTQSTYFNRMERMDDRIYGIERMHLDHDRVARLRADSIRTRLDEHRLQIANLEAYLAQLARRAGTR